MQTSVRYPEIGEKLGNRFRLVFGRGSGPNGVVFKALDLALDLPVAVKIFNPALFSSPFRDQNLLRLYRARLYQDPNLVKIFEIQEDRGFHFLSCQLIEGMSLAAVLDLHAESGEQFTLPKAKAIFGRMLDGLEVIHRTGVIHGNLKPQNIFLLADRLVLSDPYYLLSRVLQEGEEIPVHDYYRAPEQLTDPSLEIVQIDLYAAALIFGEIIGGNPVKPGLPLSQQVPRLTTRFDEWFLRATALDPTQRHGSLKEFRDSLFAVMEIVESEGLWQRRYHETGSFRAIRIGSRQDVRTVTAMPAQTAVPEAIPEPPKEALEEAEGVEVKREVAAAAPVVEVVPAEPQKVEVEPVVETQVRVEAQRIKAEQVEPLPPREPAQVAEPVPPAAPPIAEPPKTAEAVKAEAVPTEDEEGIVVSLEEPEEEAIEGIEIISEEAPPVPAEALEEGPTIKLTQAYAQDQLAPTVESAPASAQAMPEAKGDTLEMESVVGPSPAAPQPPITARMAPMQKVSGAAEQATVRKEAAAPARLFILLFALFLVVGGLSAFLVVWFSREAPQPLEKPVVHQETKAAPPQAPAAAPAPALGPADVSADTAADVVVDTGAAEPPPPPPPPPKRPLAETLVCPEGMAKIVLDPDATDDKDPAKVAFCIDTHEYPGAGQKPKVGVALTAAKSLCAKEGKRLCTGQEWLTACGKAYPYGNEYRPNVCNVDSGVLKESGSMPECRTPQGVYDLVGNASEWAADGLVHGGDVSGGAGNRCDTSSKRLLPGPTNGFRCCASATLP